MYECFVPCIYVCYVYHLCMCTMCTIYLCVLYVPCMYVYYVYICTMCAMNVLYNVYYVCMCSMCVCVLCVPCMYVYYVCLKLLEVRKHIGSPPLKVQIIVICHMVIGNQTWILCNSRECSWRFRQCLSPTHLTLWGKDSQIRLSWLTSEPQWVCLHVSGSWITRKGHHTWICM